MTHVALVVFAFLTASASGATITPVGVTGSSEFPNRNLIDTINGSGLTGNQHNIVADSMWMSSNADAVSGNAFITWDLGDIYLLSGFHMWNYNEASGGLSTRGIMSGTIQVAQDSAFIIGLQTFANQSFIQAPSSNGYLGEDYALVATGRYVRFLDLEHFPYPPAQGDPADYLGIAEIRFEGELPPPIPEPASGVLLGLGLLSLARRRRLAA